MTLRVKISHRQENFRIEGAKVQAERAMQVLQAAYEMAARPIAVEHLQLMLAGDTPLAEAEDGSMVLQTRRADLRARSPRQSVYLEAIAQNDITFGIGPAGRKNLSGGGVCGRRA
jgi:phosphate starvation-inducible PhoH-like protein